MSNDEKMIDADAEASERAPDPPLNITSDEVNYLILR